MKLRHPPPYEITDREARFYRANIMLIKWASGMTYEKLGLAFGMNEIGVRTVLTTQLRRLYAAWAKWQMAEDKLRALQWEIRELRAGRNCPASEPIESLETPPGWLRAFKTIGIETVNELRSVETDTLMANILYDQGRKKRKFFPPGAIEWAILALDSRGLTHHLTMPVPGMLGGMGSWRAMQAINRRAAGKTKDQTKEATRGSAHTNTQAGSQ